MNGFLSWTQLAPFSLAPAAASYLSSRQRCVEGMPLGSVVQKRRSAICDSVISLPLEHQTKLFSMSQALPSLLPAVHTLLLIVSSKKEYFLYTFNGQFKAFLLCNIVKY
jgi:hypothetical protein